MNNKIIWIVAIIIVAITSFALMGNKAPSDPQTPDTEQTTSSAPSGKTAGAPAIDIALCTKQPNDAYICPANALADFGPVTITDTASSNNCEISYRNTDGLSFKSKTKSSTINAGPLAVALYPSGNIATVARSATQTLSFHAREDGSLDHILLVDSNYSTVQCLSTKQDL